jgi:hypothetical protein
VITAGLLFNQIQAGNADHMPARGVADKLTMDSATTLVGLSAAPSSSTFGAPVTLTATITPTAAQGRIAFYDDVTLLGSANLIHGMASLVVRIEKTGTRQIFARYLGTP